MASPGRGEVYGGKEVDSDRAEGITFFFEREDCIKLKSYSTFLPFCREHPGRKKNNTRTPGSPQDHLLHRYLRSATEVLNEPISEQIQLLLASHKQVCSIPFQEKSEKWLLRLKKVYIMSLYSEVQGNKYMVESLISSHLTICYGSILVVYIKFVLARLVQCLSLIMYNYH